MKLSVIIPVFNEAATVENLLTKVSEVRLPEGMDMELVIIDDASTDSTDELIRNWLKNNKEISAFFTSHTFNQGKGGAIHTGIAKAEGDFLIIQDADLEYDPHEFNLLLGPMLDGNADVVYGSRFMGGRPHRVLFFWHSIGNKMLTMMSNAFTDLNLTDMETCYKLFKKEVIQAISLKEKRFGFEPEVTAKISKIPNIRIYEVGISYYGRTYNEGKKINWKDGFRAVYCILKYNLFS